MIANPFSWKSKANTHFAKKILLRPLIKNIHDSSHWYLLNVTFGATLVLHMRKKYVFEKQYFWKFDVKGVNSGLTQFYTQLTHVSRKCWALNKKEKNSFKKNFIENVVTDLWQNGLMCSKNCLEKKVCFQVFKFYVFLLFFALFFMVSLWTKIAILPQTWDHISRTILLTLFFCILFKAQNCLETCVKCVWNCVMPLFTLFEVKF